MAKKAKYRVIRQSRKNGAPEMAKMRTFISWSILSDFHSENTQFTANSLENGLKGNAEMTTRSIQINELEETEAALCQRDLLRRVRTFLMENEAEEELIGAIDIAIEDIEHWIDCDIEISFQKGLLQRGNA